MTLVTNSRPSRTRFKVRKCYERMLRQPPAKRVVSRISFRSPSRRDASRRLHKSSTNTLVQMSPIRSETNRGWPLFPKESCERITTNGAGRPRSYSSETIITGQAHKEWYRVELPRSRSLVPRQLLSKIIGGKSQQSQVNPQTRAYSSCSSLQRRRNIVNVKSFRSGSCLKIPKRIALAISGEAVVSLEEMRKYAVTLKSMAKASQCCTGSQALKLQRKYEQRLDRLKAENELLRSRWEEMKCRLRYMEWELNYERALYQEQKLLYSKIMNVNKETKDEKTQTYAVDFVYESEQLTNTLLELKSVKNLYNKQKTLTTSICEKYMKIQTKKEMIIRKMAKLEGRYRQVIEEAMANFDKDRMAFALLARDGRFPNSLQAEMATRCSTLSFNNAALHVALLKRSSDSLKTFQKDINDDISIYSILKETKNLAKYDKDLSRSRSKKSRETVKSVRWNDRQSKERFVKIPLIIDDRGQSCKSVPIFEIGNVDEESSRDSDSDSDDGTNQQKHNIYGNNSFMTKSLESNSYPTISDESLCCSNNNNETGYDSGGNGKRNLRTESEVLLKKTVNWPPKTGSAPDIIHSLCKDIK